MQIVIDIHEKDYQSMLNGYISYGLLDAIKNGIPLPKGHGDLIDISHLMRGLYEEMQVGESNYSTSEIYKMLEEETSIIIKADKEQMNDNG